jgi:hypothetical protein
MWKQATRRRSSPGLRRGSGTGFGRCGGLKLLRVFCLIPFSVSVASAQIQSAERATVSEHFGNIEFADGQGFAKTLTTDHKSGHPVLSPDGRTVAWIHIDKTEQVDQRGETSLWVADGLTGAIRKLSRGTQRDDFRSNIVNPYSAAFSLDGGFLYVTSELGSVTNGIHEIRLATDQHKFIIEGTLESAIRTGPYRGYLIVWQHRYFGPPKQGSYDGTYVVRPDAKQIFLIPGSIDQTDGGAGAVNRWLASKGWRAW